MILEKIQRLPAATGRAWSLVSPRFSPLRTSRPSLSFLLSLSFSPAPVRPSLYLFTSLFHTHMRARTKIYMRIFSHMFVYVLLLYASTYIRDTFINVTIVTITQRYIFLLHFSFLLFPAPSVQEKRISRLRLASILLAVSTPLVVPHPIVSCVCSSFAWLVSTLSWSFDSLHRCESRRPLSLVPSYHTLSSHLALYSSLFGSSMVYDWHYSFATIHLFL